MSSIAIVRSVVRRTLLPQVLIAALVLGVLVGVGAAYLRTHGRPEVTVVQAQTSSTSVGAVEVPQSAVVTDAGEQVVYVVVNGIVIRQPVHAVAATSGRDVVTWGLTPHAEVVTSPVSLKDGEKVRIP